MTKNRGLTLLELLVVILILVIVLGISIRFLRGNDKTLPLRAGAHALVSLLREARLHARSTNLPVWVHLNPTDRTAHAVTPEILGSWHFEERPNASPTFRTSGGQVPGRLGLGVLLNGKQKVDCGESPGIEPGRGYALELWISRTDGGGDQQVLQWGKMIALSLDARGQLKAKMGDRTLFIKRSIPLDAWCHIRMIQDPAGQTHVMVNQDLVYANKTRNPPAPTGTILLGSEKDGFKGIVDELVVLELVPREKINLGPATTLQWSGAEASDEQKFRLAFTSEGSLDMSLHPAPVRLTLAAGDEITLEIMSNGIVTQ